MRARLLMVFVLAAGLPAAARAATPIAGFVDTAFVTGLADPTAIAFLPSGDMLITEKEGNLELFSNGTLSTLVTIPVCTDSEMGLLGVAVDPNFGSNGFIYLYRTKAGTNGCGDSDGRFNQVVRVTMSSGSVSLSSLVELLSGMQTDGGNHDGGCLRIGPDSKLYVGVGDTGLGDNQGGPGSSTNPYSQDLSVLMGKVLRLNLDGTAPSDNPFVGQSGKRPEIYAYGFRNPFRFGFDPLNDNLWLPDVGDETWEEIDIVTAGGNYSWPYCEGTKPNGCAHAGDVAPIFTYPHTGPASLGGCVIGGAFAGAAFGSFGNDYFFGDCDSSNIYHAVPNATRDGIVGTPTLLVSDVGTPSDVVFGPDGALYYSAFGISEVHRVTPTATPPTNIDHYACYRATLAKGQAKLPAGTITHLEDQFTTPDAPTFNVKRAISICTPAQVGATTPLDPNTHQEGYAIRAAPPSPRFTRSNHLTVDEFAGRNLTVTGPASLLVPSNKVPGSGGAPAYTGTAIDHYKCYNAVPAKGSPKFVAPAPQTITDQFLSGQAVNLKRVTKLCTPVMADGSTVNHPESHLVCYQMKLPVGVKFTHATVSANNPDFGADVLVATSPSELCVPALKDP
ncbi:MAG TPA: PQQ-dependent sugar dehydrogenase [Candidatus Bathyarchaeia archaeon]|nr:PQQ-dependent sugar dehydrogenase [Candidatus Bathyarchaeia archaeon]